MPQVRLRFLDALSSGDESDGGEWDASVANAGVGGDLASAQRVVQAALGILKQLGGRRKGAGPQQQLQLRGGQRSSDEAVGGDDVPGSSDNEAGEEVEEGEDSVEEGGRGGARGSSRDSGGGGGKDFRAAWTSQADKDGLVGALVALAYPDRIAV